MSFRELLTEFYQIHAEEKVVVDERSGFISDGIFYFNTNSANSETIHMEQTVLAYYLQENGYIQTALPIKNQNESWFTDFSGSRYLTYRVAERNLDKESPGKSLAEFHQIGSVYGFEPKTISSYGQWKTLWIEKLTIFEERIHQLTKAKDVRVENQILFDALPYIIGMSENAIQYLRETEEEETRYSHNDQGTIAFLRYHNEFQREVLWPDQFVYDHPARDIVEYIRIMLITNQSDKILTEFLHDYQMIRPLSFFSWRLIYARLLFPIHLFDVMEQCLNQENNAAYDAFVSLLSQQDTYEKRLKNFYEKIGLNKDTDRLVEAEWL